jgi:hypothetical protein
MSFKVSPDLFDKLKPTVLGKEVNTQVEVTLTAKARRQGVYLIGTTGCGKTTLLQNIAFQDMANPDKPGLCFVDPHGDCIDELLARVPKDRWDDVILFDPGDDKQQERPLGLNLLECDRDNPKQVNRVTSTVIDTLRKLFSYSWGPRMEELLRQSILTLMETPDTTLLDLLLLLTDPARRALYTKVASGGLADPVARHFWEVQFAEIAKNSRMQVEVVGSSLNKIGRFLSNPLIRNIVAQPKNAFSLRQIMDEGKILLVNLSKGDLGEDNCFLLGAVLVNLILIAALQRREKPPDERRPFHLIVDEFQNFATESFATLQSEARKYGVTIIVAHQYRDQLDELNLGSTLNVANFITMRVSGRDSLELAGQFDNTPPEPEKTLAPVEKRSQQTLEGISDPLFEIPTYPGGKRFYREKELPRRPYSDVQAERANQLTILPNGRAVCRLIKDHRLYETTIETVWPPLGEEERSVRSHIRRRALRYGRDRKEVEAEIKRKIVGSEFPPGSIERAKLDPYIDDDDNNIFDDQPPEQDE